jgi:4-hydroxybenzoate polyprenyltransferase
MNWSVALRLGRVSNLPTVWTNVLTGVVLAGGGASPLTLTALIIALSLFYVGGMYLNDAFDSDFDARERPERPIPTGLVSATTVFTSGYAMLAAGLAILIWLGYGSADGTGWPAPVTGIALAAAIIIYDWRHKNVPISPVIMGICRMLTYILAGFAVTSAAPPSLFAAGAVLLCYLIGLTYAASQETLGRVRNLWPMAFLAVPFFYGVPGVSSSAGTVIFYALFLAWTGYALLFLLRPGKVNVPRAVVSLIAGISLLDAMLISGHGETGLALAAAAGFVLTLALQRFIPGT